jgi:thiamine biosynthesis protein ThiI
MRCVLVHYHEIALKGKNRPFYVKALLRNLKRATADLGVLEVRKAMGRAVLELPEGVPWKTLAERISTTFGVANFSLGESVPLDLEMIKERVGQAVEEWRRAGHLFETFRVSTRRGFKQFPLTSPEINREVGGYLKARTGAAVNLDHPDFTVHLEIIPKEAFFYFDKLPGPGGLPVGVSGRVVSLLSGGIDSPVASYRMLQRGCEVIFVHFHGHPFLSKASAEKAEELAETLTRHQYHSLLYLIPFGSIQRQVVLSAPTRLRVVLYRRLMVRIAEVIALRHEAAALVTGESLGQVASQSLQNISVIQGAAHLPILRPLIGMDKQEISEQAKRIGTYDISIQPDQDCCQLFVPPHPATRTTPEEVEAAERALDVPRLVREGVEGAEEKTFEFPPKGVPSPISAGSP